MATKVRKIFTSKKQGCGRKLEFFIVFAKANAYTVVNV